MTFLRFVYVFLFLAFVSCSSVKEFLYKKSCTSNTWEAVGEKDGERGNKDVAGWTERCQQFGTAPDSAKYEKGYAKGLGKFCQMRGFDGGKKGLKSDLPNECSEKNEKTRYEEGYDLGLHEFCTPDSGKQHALNSAPRAEPCEKVTPYQKSYDLGLKEFCTSKTAFRFGLENKPFEGKNCTANVTRTLSAAHGRGKKLFESRQKAVTLEAEINDLTKKVYDPAVPADAKTHYQTLLDTKKAELKTVEKLVYSLEDEEKRI